MRDDHTMLQSVVVLDLVAPEEPRVSVAVELRYDTRDPYAVTAAFRVPPTGSVVWCFARDLLADGLIAEAGLGDVRIRPAAADPALVDLTISSPAGLATFVAFAEDLADFLDDTYDLVPPGAEGQWVSVDDALTTLTA
ncbi:SsgA family sporulation/cell division regulator [Kutzneria kofuensis]|uniref:Sporulation and cell division protein SsgA n=1 Tax=Kutzneria kofuensis TaxID=103725 RepID=A0A7W9KNB8_9PSEU|nr:SsgA family sporulation/cell division regulator [Kutzneria kofuensis]MBB5895473.1 hypothetical protein [Kutzneria kofuensis]